jgi:tRNA pseudouridine38-40 synthase
MARYQAILTYDGTDFNGFQRQAGVRSVQSVIETGLKLIGWPGKNVLAAGRTDTGVHAAGQVIAFDIEWQHTDIDLLRAVNANLPPDVAFRSVKRVPSDFHPRYAAYCRRYLYRCFCDPIRQPLRERYAWRIWPPVSLSEVNKSAELLIGEHDFAAFGTPPRAGGKTIRRIQMACWYEGGGDLVFDITGNAFLYRMVRRLVNFQIEIGQGLREAEEISERLSGKDKILVQGLAPAQGLTLVEVSYPEDNAE